MSRAGERRIAGSDTREALETRSVRRAAQAATLGAGPGWACAFLAPRAWADALGVANTAAWLTPFLLVLGVGGAIASWRIRSRARTTADRRLLLGAGPIALAAGLSFALAIAKDARLIATLMPLAVLMSGFVVADAALLAASACVPGVRAAAAGVVASFGVTGALLPGVHVMLVGTGAGLPRGAAWTALYFGWSAFALRSGIRTLPADRHRIAIRNATRDTTPDARTHALDLHAITVRFGPNTILDAASLTVRSGELVALVGGNGAGKSTLLRVAGGFTPIESGQVLVAGEDVTTLRPEERTAVGLSFVSGARPVFPEMTVLQNLRVAAYRTHKTQRSFEQATDALLSLVPTLSARRDAMVGVLSGGEQRLLAVTQTLYRQPKVLLADELTLGLDVDARHAVMDLLQVLAEEGVAVVCVDHDLPSLLPRSHRAAVVADGGVTLYDEPVELLTLRTDLLPATFLAGIEG